MKTPDALATGLTLMILLLATSPGMAAESTVSGPADGPQAAAPVVTLQAEPFSLTDVRLLNGPFQRAMEADRRYLLSLDPDRLQAVGLTALDGSRRLRGTVVNVAGGRAEHRRHPHGRPGLRRTGRDRQSPHPHAAH